MLPKSIGFIGPAVLACALLVSGCAMKDDGVMPPAGTSVTTQSDEFRLTARSLEDECVRRGGCTCFLDGIQTTCGLVFACLDAGFCERVATQ